MQQCSELASAVAGSKLCAPDVQNNGFISGHAHLHNGEPNAARPPAAAGTCDGGSSWASCCANICNVKKFGNSPRVNYLQLTNSGLRIEWLLKWLICVCNDAKCI